MPAPPPRGAAPEPGNARQTPRSSTPEQRGRLAPSHESEAARARGPLERTPVKVFIYHQFIANPAIAEHNARLAAANRLGQHLQYLQDFYAYFRNFETTDPDEADFFFVPLFMAGWQFANHDPADFIALCAHVGRGRHVLLSSGDVGQRAESRHELKMPGRAYEKKYAWLDDRFVLLALESTPLLHAQDVAFLPYAIRDIVPLNLPRDLFASFMGAMSYSLLPPEHIRGHVMLQLKTRHAGDAGVLLGTVQEVAAEQGRSLGYDEVMARSVFTLCPAGYGRWSFRFIEALLHGSIPVLLCDDYVMPFADQVRWDDYCIVVPEKDALATVETLRALPVERVTTLQANILRDRARFMRPAVLDALRRQLEGQRGQAVALAAASTPEAVPA